MKRLISFCVAVVCLGGAAPLGTTSAAPPFFRNPVVLSIAPDEIDCDNPDDPDNVEDVQIAGICFFGAITSAFLSLNADGSGTQIQLTNVVNVGRNIITATVPLNQLTERDTPYFVFVVRGTDGKVSTAYPNAFGFDVTFSCSAAVVSDSFVVLTSCKVVRVGAGRLVLQVTGTGFIPNDTVVLLNGTPCRKNKYPKRFIDPSANTTTRIDCSGGLDQLLPAVVTARTTSTGQLSQNSLNCDR